MTEVHAAGGVVWRAGRDGPEVLIVHRPRYDDWSLPKGKLDPGERFEDAALREVLEEAGVEATLGEELDPIRYHDNKGRPKLVRYWVMTVDAETAFTRNDEVDEIRWAPPAEAARLLTYERDADLVLAAAPRLG